MKCSQCEIKKIKEELERVEKCEDCNEPIVNDKYVPHWHPQPINNKTYSTSIGCLHDMCPGCKSGTCNGVHMLSCSRTKCSPRW